MRTGGQAWHTGVIGALVAMVVMIGGPSAMAQDGQRIIDITNPNVEPYPIALPEFFGATGDPSELGQNVTRVIVDNLTRSGLFRVVDPAAYLEGFSTLDVQPRFNDWRAIGAAGVVQGQVQIQDDGQLRAAFRLWDVIRNEQLAGQAFVTQAGNWRRVAHIISDQIYSRLTGEEGYFDTRIVYIAESGPKTERVKRLAIMDQDGANHRFLTDGSALVLTPRFSPTAQEITYMSYYRNVPRVYLFNIDTGRQELLGDFPGMTFAPRFSPDGQNVIMSMARDGNTEIYEMELRTRRVRRLTNHPAIDTSPSYAPSDIGRITFNSDRSGEQELYVMNADGSNPQRISFGDGRYATPVWSPRGDLIAFTKMHRGTFYIGVMRPDGSGERLLTEGYLVESPTWSPNGRVLMFFSEQRSRADGSGGGSKIYSIDLTGRNQRLVVTPLDASDPAWSPSLE